MIAEVDVVFVMNTLLKLRRVFGHLKLANRGIFLEAGSGPGKNVYVAALTHSWQRCVGIDMRQSFTDHATRLKLRFDDDTCSFLTEKQRQERDNDSIDFVCGNFFDTDLLVTASVVYVDLTCMPSDPLRRFTNMLDDLATAAVVITLTRPLDTSKFFLLWTDPHVATSWGTTTAFIYERKPPTGDDDDDDDDDHNVHDE